MFRELTTVAAALAGSVLVLGLFAASAAEAATIFQTTQLVANSAQLEAQLPAPITFDVPQAGSYNLRLRDLSTPGPLSSLRAVVTCDLQVVADATVSYSNGVPAPDPASDSFQATPGPCRILVIGTVGADEAGTFGVSIEPAAGGADIVNVVGDIAADNGPPTGVSQLTTSFEVVEAGNYQVEVTDQQFPAALVQIRGIVLPDAQGEAPTAIPVTTSFPATIPVTANPGTHQLIIVATAAAPRLAGLYTVRVAGGPLNSTRHLSTNAVGKLPRPADVSFSSAGQWTLTLADAQLPTQLTSLRAAVTQGGALLQMASGATSVNFNAAQGPAQVFTLGESNTVGAFSVRIANIAQVIHSDLQSVDASPDTTTPAIYTFAPSAAIAAGNYVLRLEDFRFPTQLAALNAVIAQGDTIVARLTGSEQATVALQAAPVKVLVAASPPAGTSTAPGNGLFGLSLAAQTGGAVVFESTQGVGGLFRSEPVNIPAAGRYDFTLADLEFPATLRTSALAITFGTELVGQIFGEGTVSRQQLAQGTYVLNFLGQPASNQSHGAYGLKVADSPPVPTITFSATPTTITSGQQTTLQWTATNATTCTAAGGWSGSKSVSGSEQTAALSATATFELSCTGPGGSANASTSVTVNPPSAGGSGGGGGGSIGWLFLAWMGVLAVLASRKRAD